MESSTETDDTLAKHRKGDGGAETISLSRVMSALAREGYGVYRRPERVSMGSSELRPLENHLWHLSEICADLSIGCSGVTNSDLELGSEWGRVILWLRMAAGLGHVEIDLAYGEPDLFLCGRAADYHEAVSDCTSAFTTEQTRLLYAWNAVERLLKTLPLPSVSEAPSAFNRATRLLMDHWDGRELPRYFDPVLNHLCFHVENDPWLLRERRLRTAFEVTPWRTKSGFLLAAANQLRHLPAHGDLDMPQPVTWGTEAPSGSEQVASALHLPRLAARGLALSLQMLLVAGNLNVSQEGLRTPRRGWWFYDADEEWHRGEPPLRMLLEQAHLRPPNPERYGLYDPDAEYDEYEDDSEPTWE